MNGIWCMMCCPPCSGCHGGGRVSTFGFQQDDGGDADLLKLFEDSPLVDDASHNHQFPASICQGRYARNRLLKQRPISGEGDELLRERGA